MAYFDRFDICAAWYSLECDWNLGGWLQERTSNQRRRESCGVQLQRMGYRGFACGFDTLENDNQREIYCNAMQSLGLIPAQDSPIIAWFKGV